MTTWETVSPVKPSPVVKALIMMSQHSPVYPIPIILSAEMITSMIPFMINADLPSTRDALGTMSTILTPEDALDFPTLAPWDHATLMSPEIVKSFIEIALLDIILITQEIPVGLFLNPVASMNITTSP